MVTFTINIPPMLAYIPYMDPMGDDTPWTFFGDLQTNKPFPACHAAPLAAPKMAAPIRGREAKLLAVAVHLESGRSLGTFQQHIYIYV
jgi:hypothetical protein